MTRATKSRNSLDGKIVNLRRGLAVYKVKASPYYRVRVWIPSQKKRIVRTSKATTRAEAISVAEELFRAMGTKGALDHAPSERTFEHFAHKLVQLEKLQGERGALSARAWYDTQCILQNPERGLLVRFGDQDVTKIATPSYHAYFDSISKNNPSLAPATLKRTAVVFSKVMKLAQADGLIDAPPASPRIRHKDNPRSFFRFKPLVSADADEWRLLKKTAKEMASERVEVRGTLITEELYDFILFMVHSFLRPTESEVYALTHRDLAIAADPQRLILTIRKGKTGHRVCNTMPDAVPIYERIAKRYPNYSAEDFVFLPSYKNRSHAKRIIQRQFNAILERAGLKKDHFSHSVHTVYSLRHTAICMRLVLSKGTVNIFNLAKNAGTSVDQIERFYAKNLPLSPEMTRNLQSFGTEE